MVKIVFLLIGIALISSGCGSGDIESRGTTDTVALLKPSSTWPNGNTNNDKYICGFTGGFAYVDDIPLAVGLSSTDDSAIERTFTFIWRNVIGGRTDAIKIEKDADQNNTEYKYAAAKGSFTDIGNIVRYVFYKANDLSPLLQRDNGWDLRAIALHEFAHHINGDPFTGVSRDIAELGADDYAGYMMGQGKMKTTLDTALLAFSNFTEENPTNGYPNRQKRTAAVKAGWERAQISDRFSLVSAFITIETFPWDNAMTDMTPYKILEQAINENGSLKAWNDTSTADKAKVTIRRASRSPGDFFVDSNYLYVITKDSTSVVGRVARSNRPEYRQMVYDNFYNYMYIDSNNTLITYVVDFEDPKKSLKPIIIGSLSELRHR